MINWFFTGGFRRRLLTGLLLVLPIPLAAVPIVDPLELDNQARSRPFGQDQRFAQVIDYVNQGNFDQAARMLAELKTSMADRYEVWEIEGTMMLIQGRAADAAAALERALELSPGSPVILAKRAVAWFMLSRVDEAEAELQQVLSLRPDDTYALRYLARIADARGDAGGAADYYQRVIDLTESAYTPLHEEFANFLLRSGQPASVERLLRPLVHEASPAGLHVVLMHAALAANDSSKARNELATAQSRGLGEDDVRFYGALIDRATGNRAVAAQALRRLNSDFPENPLLAYELAVTLAMVGETEEGLSLASDAAAVLPAEHVLRLDIADLLLSYGDGDAAAEVLGPALVGVTDARVLTLAVRAAIQSGDTDSAIRYSDGMVETFPMQEAVYMLRAGVLESAGRSNEAAELARLATERFPDSVDIWLSRITLLVNQNTIEAALAAGDEALALHSNHPALLFQAASVNEIAGRSDAAEAIYSELVSIPAVQVLALNNLALLVARDAGRLAEALDYAEQAYELDAQWATIEDTLGWILHLNGRGGEAIEHFRAALQRDPSNTEILCHLGIVAAEAEQSEAAGLIERCLSLGPPQALADTVNELAGL